MSAVDITGVGAVTPGGLTLDATWNSLVSGRQSRTVVRPPRGWKLPERLSAGLVGHSALFDLAAPAADAAIGEQLPDAVIVGSSSDSYCSREAGLKSRPRLAYLLAGKYGLDDRHVQVSNACASSSTAIAMATDFIRHGVYSRILVGGADEVSFSSIAGFTACRMYSSECLPFAHGQRGLYLSEGAAFVTLESADTHAERRLARLAGAGLVSGAQELVDMSSAGVERAMRKALLESQMSARSIDLVIAHGTGTVVNDSSETVAIANVFRDRIPPVCSYKRWIGHPQGASGAIGVALAVKALQTQRIFPTGSGRWADYVPDNMRITTGGKERMDAIMVLSHGTWDIYTALVVTR